MRFLTLFVLVCFCLTLTTIQALEESSTVLIKRGKLLRKLERWHRFQRINREAKRRRRQKAREQRKLEKKKEQEEEDRKEKEEDTLKEREKHKQKEDKDHRDDEKTKGEPNDWQ